MTKEISTQTTEIARLTTRYGELFSKQNIVNEETSDKVLSKLKSNQDVPVDVLKDIQKVLYSSKDKQNLINYEKEMINDELLASLHVTNDDVTKFVLGYIRGAYAMHMTLTVERLQEDLSNKIT